MATIILLTVITAISVHFVRRPVKRTVRADYYRCVKFDRTRSEQAALRSAVYW